MNYSLAQAFPDSEFLCGQLIFAPELCSALHVWMHIHERFKNATCNADKFSGFWSQGRIASLGQSTTFKVLHYEAWESAKCLGCFNKSDHSRVPQFLEILNFAFKGT